MHTGDVSPVPSTAIITTTVSSLRAAGCLVTCRDNRYYPLPVWPRGVTATRPTIITILYLPEPTLSLLRCIAICGGGGGDDDNNHLASEPFPGRLTPLIGSAFFARAIHFRYDIIILPKRGIDVGHVRDDCVWLCVSLYFYTSTKSDAKIN